MTTPQHFYRQLGQVLQCEPAVVGTIVKVVGSAPREIGAKMAVYGSGEIVGTIGGGAGEGKVIQQALIVLKESENKPASNQTSNQLVEIDLTGASKQKTQGICGGKVQVWLEIWKGEQAIARVQQILEIFETGKSKALVTPLISNQFSYIVDIELDKTASLSLGADHQSLDHQHFVEIIQPPPVLLIIGGGHVAVALAQAASFAGFQITVQDDRPDFVTPERFPQAKLLSHTLSETLAHFTAHSQLYIALVARGYPQDVEALQTLLQRPIAYQYVGAIGSQKRIRTVYRALEQQGISIKRLPNFYAPIGLDIGALTPEEIAVSICAELIKVRRGGTGRSLCERMQLSGALSKVHAGERRYAHLPQ